MAVCVPAAEGAAPRACSDADARAHGMLVDAPSPADDMQQWVLRAHASVAGFRMCCRLRAHCGATTAELRFVDYFSDILECLVWECCDAPTVVAALTKRARPPALALQDVFPDASLRSELAMHRHSVASWRVRYNAIVYRVLAARGAAGAAPDAACGGGDAVVGAAACI